MSQIVPVPLRYVVIGAGAVGLTLAAQLQLAGQPVVLAARGATGDHLAEHPLELHRPDGVHRVRLTVARRPEQVDLTPSDVLVLTTKSQDIEQVLREWAWQPVGERGRAAELLPVLTVQNGLESERAALRRFRTVIAGSIRIPASHLVTGVAELFALDPVAALLLGEYPGAYPSGTVQEADSRDPLVRQIAADLTAADYAVQTSGHIQRWKAEKLVRCTTFALDVLPGPDDDRTLLEHLLKQEAVAALHAAGIEPQTVDALADRLRSYGVSPQVSFHPAHRSTWQSLERGAHVTETDFLNGEIVLLGRLHGVPTPASELVQQTVDVLAATAPSERRPPSVTQLVVRLTGRDAVAPGAAR